MSLDKRELITGRKVSEYELKLWLELKEEIEKNKWIEKLFDFNLSLYKRTLNSKKHRVSYWAFPGITVL